MLRRLCYRLLAALPALSVAGFAHAAPDTKTLQAGSWTVFRNIDDMTDKTTCVGIYKSNRAIQLGADGLYVKVAGGIQSITLRFDDEPADATRLPSKLEKEMGVIILDNDSFARAFSAERLRSQVLTLVRGVDSQDLELTGIIPAVNHMREGCPVGADSKPKATDPPSRGACSEPVISRMKAQGLRSQQIDAICRG